MSWRWPIRSIQGRLLLASTLVMPLVMLFAGIALKSAYNTSLEAGVNERLQLQAYLLLGSIEVDESLVVLPEALQEPRYTQVGSGLYGLIHDPSGEQLWRSASAELENLPTIPQLAPFRAGLSAFDHLPDAGLYRYRFNVVWERNGHAQPLQLTVMESDRALKVALNAYVQELTLWLAAVLVGALIALVLIMRWGIMPLRGLARDLRQIEQGDAAQLEGRYPEEVQPVTDNLNRLILHEREQRERYRNTLGDLAHSLKTPLAVMQGAAEEELSLDEYRQVVHEQVQRMDQIVQYQLKRAVKSRGQALAQPVVVAPLVQRMLAVLDKVYREKGIDTDAAIEPALGFAGDERDLMELLGNLLENAYKYGASRVSVDGRLEGEAVVIAIGDDGPGVSPEARQVILERGERLDTSVQGQGIGLSVVLDIVSGYDGRLEVGVAPLGGALFTVTLPGSSVSA